MTTTKKSSKASSASKPSKTSSKPVVKKTASSKKPKTAAVQKEQAPAVPKTEQYVLKSQIHFVSLKTSIPSGTRITVRRDDGKVEINGNTYDNLSEVDMMVRTGFIVPFTGEAKSIPQPSKPVVKKMEVRHSDQDMVESLNLDPAPGSKSIRQEQETIEVIREDRAEKLSRGLEVVSSDRAGKTAGKDGSRPEMSVVSSDEREVGRVPARRQPRGVPGLSSSNDASTPASDDASLVNGEQEGTVVRKIGKSAKTETKTVSAGPALKAKHSAGSADASAKAKAAAEARKAAIAAKRAENAE